MLLATGKPVSCHVLEAWTALVIAPELLLKDRAPQKGTGHIQMRTGRSALGKCLAGTLQKLKEVILKFLRYYTYDVARKTIETNFLSNGSVTFIDRCESEAHSEASCCPCASDSGAARHGPHTGPSCEGVSQLS